MTKLKLAIYGAPLLNEAPLKALHQSFRLIFITTVDSGVKDIRNETLFFKSIAAKTTARWLFNRTSAIVERKMAVRTYISEIL